MPTYYVYDVFQMCITNYNYDDKTTLQKKTKLAESKILPDWKYFLYYNCCLWLEWNKQKKINKCIKKPKLHLSLSYNFFPNECPGLCWHRPGHSLGNFSYHLPRSLLRIFKYCLPTHRKGQSHELNNFVQQFYILLLFSIKYIKDWIWVEFN